MRVFKNHNFLAFIFLILVTCSCTKKESHKATLPPIGTIPAAITNDKSQDLQVKSEIVDNLPSEKLTKKIQSQKTLAEQGTGNSTRVNGSVVSVKKGSLSFQTRGFIAKLYADVGDNIKKGQVIAVLDDRGPVLQKQIQQQSVQLAKIKLEKAKRELVRTQELVRRNASTAFQLEQAQDEVSSSQLQLSQAQASLALSEKSLSDTRLFAPYDGKISAKLKDIGEFVAEGMSVFNAFEDKNVEISLQVHEAQISKIKIGMNIQISIPSINQTISAKVTKIVDSISQDTRMFEVRAKQTDLGLNMIPGQFVEATF